jgi:sugar lactone lactonase YvrE
VSSRFEGTVHRLREDGTAEMVASDLGVPCGLAFGPDSCLYVGDRSGSILRVRSDRQVQVVASLPVSVAAYHLAFGPDGCLYVTAPTLSSNDGVYRVTPDGQVAVARAGFGRPQGLAFDHLGRLYLVEALAGSSGLYRLDLDRPDAPPECVLAGSRLIGLAFDPMGGMVVASADTVYRLDVPLRPLGVGA